MNELKELLLKVRALEIDPFDIDIMVDNDKFLIHVGAEDVYECYADAEELLKLLFPSVNVWKC